MIILLLCLIIVIHNNDFVSIVNAKTTSSKLIKNSNNQYKFLGTTPFFIQSSSNNIDNNNNKYAFIVKDLYRGGGIDDDNANDDNNDNEVEEEDHKLNTQQQNNDESGVNVIDNKESDDDIDEMDGEFDNKIVVEEIVSVQDEDEDENKEKLKEQGIGDPSDSDNDDISDSDDNDDIISEDNNKNDDDGILMKSPSNEKEEDTNNRNNVVVTEEIILSEEQEVEEKSTKLSIEEAICNALKEMLLISPPTQEFINDLQLNTMNEDISSRKLLDRRTLYRMLLLELLPTTTTATNETNNVTSTTSTKTKRKYLNDNISTSLRAAVSLASQPKWRKHVITSTSSSKNNDESDNDNDKSNTNGIRTESSIFYNTNNIKLYPDDYSSSSSDDNSNNKDVTTMSMQETVAMAIAHSLNLGFIILDDKRISYIKQYIYNHTDIRDKDNTSSSSSSTPELKTSFILQSITNILNKGLLGTTKTTTTGISSLMKEDYDNHYDTNYDELANISYTKQIQDEITYPSSPTANANDKPLSCLFFIRTNDSSMLLRSKSSVDVVLKEMNIHNDNSIHLFALGKNMDIDDAVSTSSSSSSSSDDYKRSRGSRSNSWSSSNSPFFNQQQQQQQYPHQQQQASSPFYQMNQDDNTMNNNPNNNNNGMNNASGQNDPEGSKRVNIFLARTLDSDGNPGIIGTIAPPAAGNIFPQMLAMHQQRQAQEKNNGNNGGPQNNNNPFDGLSSSSNTEDINNNGFDKLFFNTSLSSDDTSEQQQQKQQQQQPMIPPEILQRVIQQAITQMIEQLSQLPSEDDDENSSSNNNPYNNIQQEVIKYFSEMLQNDHLKRSVTDNLIRAAPALLDPRCQGIMLSVYIPPGNNHPNRGMMPMPSSNSNNNNMPLLPNSKDTSSTSGSGGGGGWWNKILQPGATTTTNTNSSQQTITEETSSTTSSSEETTTTGSPSTSSKTKTKKEPSTKTTLTPEAKQRRGLLRLSSHTQTISLSKPIDQVRTRSWDSWIQRQIHCIYFTQNIYKLQCELQLSNLKVMLNNDNDDDAFNNNVNYDDFYRNVRQLLSMRDISKKEMKDAVKSIIEVEAAKSQRSDDYNHNDNDNDHHNENINHTDTQSTTTNTSSFSSLSTLYKLFNDYDMNEDNVIDNKGETTSKHQIDYIHPTTIEKILSQVCQSAPSSSSSTSSSLPSSYRTKEEISSLAQDKHERALVSNVVLPQDIGINYDMIGGLNEVKELLRQSITYPLKYPHLYSEGIAREAVKGVLLFGPPGTGKTMLAKAVATEGGATFLSIDASSVENKWLGESEKNAKAVFTLARRLAPCVIFLDEVDSLLSSREGSGSDDSAHGTLTSVKTTMMSEWDGLNSATSKYSDNRVIVIGSTNRPYDLDEAVLRRFPRRILVDLPDLETRREILEVTLAENRIDISVNFTSIADLLDGYTGSDIKEVCREAVVQISHEQARLLDSTTSSTTISNTMMKEQRLRPATLDDFEKAIGKLKKSVSTKGKELIKVLDWNDEYGEIKNTNRNNKDSLPQVLNMFL